MGLDRSSSSDSYSINGSGLDNASTMNESIIEPDSVLDNNVVTPTILTPDEDVEDRRQRRGIEEENLENGVGVEFSPSEENRKSLMMKHDESEHSSSRKSNFLHVHAKRESYIHESRRGRGSRSGWEEFYLPRNPNFDLNPTGHIGDHISTDSSQRQTQFHSSICVPNTNGDRQWDVPILPVIATPVPDEVEIVHNSNMTKRTLCLQKIMLIVMIILALIAGSVAFVAYQQGLFSKKNSASASPSSQGTFHSKSSMPSLHFSTQEPVEEPSMSPSIIPTSYSTSSPAYDTAFPSEIMGHSPSAAPTKGCQPWCVNHPTPWIDLDPNASQKCKWPVNCGGCPECIPSPSLSLSPTIPISNCLSWCKNHAAPWWDEDPEIVQKCKWPETCSGCPQCSDLFLNPGN